MKRRDFIKVTGLGVAGAATIAAPAIAQSMPEIKWRMPTSWPKSLDTLYGGAEMMAKAVAQATDNKFQIQPFAGGEIVPGQRQTVRKRPAVLGQEGGALNGVDQTLAGPDATNDTLVEAGIRLHGVDAVVTK